LQLGFHYFDTAHDTVVVTKPKVESMPMAASGFRSVESFADFATIAERYWGVQVFPNCHFPRLAPLLPILWLSPDGVLGLHSHIYFMQRMKQESGFRDAEAFLTRSEWATRPLPPDWEGRVQRFKERTLSPEARTPPGGAGPERLAAECAACRANQAYGSPAFLARIFTAATTVVITADE